MKYSIVKLHFLSQVRFGINSLENSFSICHSDTLFSSIFIETLNLKGEKEALSLVEKMQEGNLNFSSALPYLYDEVENEYRLYVPKPIIKFETDKEIEVTDKSMKKMIKKIDYLSILDINNYLDCVVNNDVNEIEQYQSKIICENNTQKVNLEDKQLYTVSSNVFLNKALVDGNRESNAMEIEGRTGLYFIIAYKDDEDITLLKEVLNSLQYSGIGGKRNVGYGRFEIEEIKDLSQTNQQAEQELYQRIIDSDNYKNKMLISLLSLSDKEIDELDIENIYYSLIKRSGFVQSSNYANKNLKKKDIYMMAEGTTIKKVIKGEIKDLSKNGKHPVFRNGIGLYIGVR